MIEECRVWEDWKGRRVKGVVRIMCLMSWVGVSRGEEMWEKIVYEVWDCERMVGRVCGEWVRMWMGEFECDFCVCDCVNLFVVLLGGSDGLGEFVVEMIGRNWGICGVI